MSLILDLPNELVGLVVAHVPNYALRNLALAHRRFLPFVRRIRLRAIKLLQPFQLVECLAWCRDVGPSVTACIRSVVFGDIYRDVFTGTYRDFDQEQVADLLDLVPALESLSVGCWTETTDVAPSLRQSVAGLTGLKSLFLSRPCGPAVVLRGQPFSQMLASLPPGSAMRTVCMPLGLERDGLEWPAGVTTESLVMVDPLLGFQTGAPKASMLAQSEFAQLRALGISADLLTTALLQAVAPTLEALALDGHVRRDWLGIQAPRLTLLAGTNTTLIPSPFDFENPLPTGLFDRVRTILWPTLIFLAHGFESALFPHTYFPALEAVYYIPEDPLEAQWAGAFAIAQDEDDDEDLVVHELYDDPRLVYQRPGLLEMLEKGVGPALEAYEDW